MSYTQKLVSLKKDDLKLPMRIANSQTIMFFVLMIAMPVFSFFVLFEERLDLAISLALFTIVVMGIVMYIVNKYNSKVRDDFKNGKKLQIKGVLQDKYSTGFGRSRMFYFAVGEKQLKMAIKYFYEYEIGDMLQVEIAPKSEYVISVKTIKIE